MTTHTTFDSPLGPVVAVARDGALARLLLDGTRRPPEPDRLGARDDAGLAAVRAQLEEYFAGERQTFDLELRPAGSAFQRRVWDGLRRIPFGETWSYGELAAEVGLDPRTASRAVGAANGANPIAIVVPCHRVIGADGSLVGFAAGVERKRWLLDHEAALAATRLF
jgi:methylated-DNA-[protein]-cysteine S-methyltransferase